MTPFEKFCSRMEMPSDIGRELPYVQLGFVSTDQSTGADAAVEWIEGDDEHRIRVSVSEWKKAEAGVIREPVMQVEFSERSGELLVPAGEGGEVMADLLLAMQGMRVLGGDDASA